MADRRAPYPDPYPLPGLRCPHSGPIPYEPHEPGTYEHDVLLQWPLPEPPPPPCTDFKEAMRRSSSRLDPSRDPFTGEEIEYPPGMELVYTPEECRERWPYGWTPDLPQLTPEQRLYRPKRDHRARTPYVPNARDLREAAARREIREAKAKERHALKRKLWAGKVVNADRMRALGMKRSAVLRRAKTLRAQTDPVMIKAHAALAESRRRHAFRQLQAKCLRLVKLKRIGGWEY